MMQCILLNLSWLPFFLFLSLHLVENEVYKLHATIFFFRFKLVVYGKSLQKLQRIQTIAVESLFHFSDVLWEKMEVLFYRKYSVLVAEKIE